MIIGIPKEIKSDEYRVALIPVGVEEMTKHGHRGKRGRDGRILTGCPRMQLHPLKYTTY